MLCLSGFELYSRWVPLVKLKSCCLSNRLLCPKTLATFLETFDHVLGNRAIDEVSPMFSSEHANTWDAKQILQILFFHNPNKFFCDS